MEAHVIKAYTDKADMKVHLAGEAVELDEQRAEELSARGFVSVAFEPEPDPGPDPDPEKPKPSGRRAPAKKG